MMFEFEDIDFTEGQELVFCYYYGFAWRVEPEVDEGKDDDNGGDV